MSRLPIIPVPDSFDRDVILRAALLAMPVVVPPADFEEQVLDRCKKQTIGGFLARNRVSVVALLCVLLIGSIGIVQYTRPTVVGVVPPTLVDGGFGADLDVIPPVFVVEDVVATRWSVRARRDANAKAAVYAGH